MKVKYAPLRLSVTQLFVFSFFIFNCWNATSQTVYYDTIKKQKFALIEIHKTYERVIAKGYNSVEMYEYLGNYYYNNQDFKKSKLYFDKLFKKYKLSQISSKSKEMYSTL